MSVVGFDIGNETCVIAVAKQRGIDVLLNDESERENPALVSFGEKQRFIGCAGAASASMNPKSTISQVKRLIGRTFSEPSVQDDLKMLPFETSEGSDGGILVHLQYLKEKRTFTPIQILAMLLAHLKQIAEKNLEVQVGNCVIGIPSYFTALQRRAYLYAAEIAGLKPLKLMHDCTATGLGYGVYKTDFPESGAANVAFVDVGHCDTQVAVVSFVQGNMKVLSHAFDSSLGGRDFDEVLFRHFAAKFQEQNSIDVYSNVRACIRLRAACEKLKRVLSANPEAPLNIECLMDEKDMQGYIKREDFEELSSGLLERIRIPCQKALADSGLSVENVHNVELVGSGSRIPAITKILTSVFGQEPRRTLNASECFARGCALECAKLSPIFRVKEYEMQDCFPFSIGLASDDRPVSTLSDGKLFPKGNPFPCLKMLTLHQRDIFHLEASYTNLNELPSGVSTRISSYKIGPLGVSHVETAKLRIKIHLNLHGIVNIESASLIDDHVDDSSSNNSTSTISENVGPSNNEPSSKSKGPYGNEVKDLQQIPIDEDAYGGMTSNELSKAKEQELWYVQQDINMERTKEKKNALEAYVYETRNKLLDTYRSFATDSEKEGICNHLQQTENWLYEDGDDETEHVYTEKLEHLKKMVDPIDNRLKEEDARALATRKLLGCIVEYRMAVISLPTTERDAVTIECNKAEHWLRDRSQQQDSLPKTSDPILLSSEIYSKAETLNEICKQMIESKSSSPMPSPRPSPRPVESKSSSPMPSPRPVESKSSSPMPSPRPSPRPVEPKSFSPMPSPRPSLRPVDAGESERKATEKEKLKHRRFLQGSAPPDCIDKCEECTPCVATLIRVPPKRTPPPFGGIFQEYYPQAWKCACGGILYDPSNNKTGHT